MNAIDYPLGDDPDQLGQKTLNPGSEFEEIQTLKPISRFKPQSGFDMEESHQISLFKKKSWEIKESSENWGFFLKDKKKNPLNKSKEWQKGSIKIDAYVLPLIRRFIFRMKRFFLQKSLKHVSEDMLKMINDKSFFLGASDAKYKNILSLLNHFYKSVQGYLHKNIPVIYPFENYKVAWDILHFLIMIFLFFFIPLDVCFATDFPQELHLFVTAFFVIDIFLNFTTAYFHNGFMVISRPKIAKHYLHNFFIYDFLTAFIFLIDYIIKVNGIDYHTNSLSLFKFLFFLRLNTFRSLYNRLLEKFRLSTRVHMSAIELVNLLFISLMILHFFASFWFMIADHHLQDPSYQTWLTVKGFTDKPIFDLYVISLYWSAVTIMTVGYGDISATNMEETIFSIFTVVVGCVVFAYIINSIGMIVGEVNRENILFK